MDEQQKRQYFNLEEKIMLTIFIRTIIIYALLVATMRIMGKRQLGELELSDLVTTFLLSEIASTPITNTEIPIMKAIIPIATLASLEILFSFIMLKIPTLKKILTSRPSTVISRGKIDKREMSKLRISLDELISQIRQSGIYDLCEVDYAILEENGKMSIIPKKRNRPPDADALGIECDDSGVMHILISDGQINSRNLKFIGRNEAWLNKIISAHKLKAKEIFCMTCDDSFNIFIQTQSGKTIKLRES